MVVSGFPSSDRFASSALREAVAFSPLAGT